MKASRKNSSPFWLSWLRPFGKCSEKGNDCTKAQQILHEFHEKILQVRDDFYQIEALLFQRNLQLAKLKCPDINRLLN